MNNNKHTSKEVRLQVNIDDLKCGDWIERVEPGLNAHGKVTGKAPFFNINGRTGRWAIFTKTDHRELKAEFDDPRMDIYTFTILRNETNATQGECL